jgi:hypothetical protein
MSRLVFVVILLASPALTRAQDVALWEAKRDISNAKEQIEKVVVFCEACEASGKIEERPCPHCQGHGVLLKCEAERIKHRDHLERRAKRAGASADRYAEFDAGNRLAGYEKEIEPQALEMLVAYVGYVKMCRRHEEIVKEDGEFAGEIADTIKQLDGLIDRHARRLRLRSLRMLYEEDPVGKVGIFKLYGIRKPVRIDGQELEHLKLRTLKGCSILIRKSEAKERKGYLLAEIVGKDTYKTDDGQSITAIMLRPW